MSSKFKKGLSWLIFNSALALCVWAAVIGQNVGFANVLYFVAWILAICSILTMTSEKAVACLKKLGPSVPSWLGRGFGILLVLFLVMHGWWATAIAFTITEAVETIVHSDFNFDDELDLGE